MWLLYYDDWLIAVSIKHGQMVSVVILSVTRKHFDVIISNFLAWKSIIEYFLVRSAIAAKISVTIHIWKIVVSGKWVRQNKGGMVSAS